MKKMLAPAWAGLLMLCTFTLYAQKNFAPGYVVLQDGTRQEGWLENRDTEQSPERIRFKATEDGREEHFGPLDLQEFGVAGQRFFSAIVDLETSPDQMHQLDEHAGFHLVRDTVFVQALVMGPKSLYLHKPALYHASFYIGDLADGLQLLPYKRFIKRTNWQQQVVENDAYTTLLLPYLSSCPAINEERMAAIEYTREALQDLVLEFYACQEIVPEYVSEIPKVHFHLGAIAGLNISQLSTSGSIWVNIAGPSYDVALGPVLGLSAELVLARNHGRLSFYNELQYSSFSTQGSYTDFVSDNQYTDYVTEFSFSYLRLLSMLRYRWHQGKVDWFLNAGLGLGSMLRQRQFSSEHIVFFNSVRDNQGPAIDALRRQEGCLVAGIGGQTGPWSLEARYVRGSGIEAYFALRTVVHRGQLVLGYRF